jgi:branched-chain amino acid transport system ATP-binding protein
VNTSDQATEPTGPSQSRALLSVRDLHVSYGRAPVLGGIDFDVGAGTAVAVLGANGAGKTTLLRAITGILGFSRGRITSGSVCFDGEVIDRLDAASIVRRGVAQVLEGRRVFASLTIEDNVRAGAHTLRRRRAIDDAVDHVFDAIPLLAERRHALAGSLSGGQQQLLAIGRAVVSSPRLLLLDEPTLGLSPTSVELVRVAVDRLHAQGTTVIVIDQRATLALSVAERGIVMASGRVVRSGAASELRDDPALSAAYLGANRT